MQIYIVLNGRVIVMKWKGYGREVMACFNVLPQHHLEGPRKYTEISGEVTGIRDKI
jgi:hypothetical protein